MSRRKLLLADDSITIQKVVNLTFADEGIEVIAVGDGNSAFDRMQETPPDLVMADVNMPGLSGYDLCERIKQDERLRHIPVILLVGSFEPFDETEAARVGADDFLTKPFQSIRQLVNKVTGMLETTENSRVASASGFTPAAEIAESAPAETALSQENEFTAKTAPPAYDAGEFDDETIQTSSVSSFALDEAHKFESRTFDADDAGKTQPLSARDLKDFAFVEEAAREFGANERAYDSAQESSAAQDAADDRSENTGVSETANVAARPAPPVFDFDDFNILEIPLDEEEASSAQTAAAKAAPTRPSEIASNATETAESYEENYSGESTAVRSLTGDAAEAEFVEEIKEAEEGKTIAETEAEIDPAAETKAPALAAASNVAFPPEVIEAIAQRVAEKLADSTANDVAPRVADLIIQKMAEEKLKH